ncbi:Sensory transduction histidine kinase [Pedobacter sp. BAL39]|uniref:ATP-binding protein n=1 Tax=Pedobacter sp. BAL39 TaxID=391596 RepID=UPI0001559C36|nr:sensor histidine kinase [Pedobacter sp. BAL39]EDM35498.1 Sensory transduction histidine kinase [Pedobacter sp. BAL39]
MINVISISLENEMDLILAHKRSMRLAEQLGLTIATQTTFATAVSEIARSVIEHTDSGVLEVGLQQQNQRYSLMALISYEKDIELSNNDEGFYYAQKLVPEFNIIKGEKSNQVEMKIGIPRSLRVDKAKVAALQLFFMNDAPINAYESLKKRNSNLNKIAGEQEEEIRRSRFIDEKKNEFIAVASHELKTPITVIKAYIQMVKASKDECSDRLKGYVEKIDYQINKLTMLVQQLLDVSKIENGHLVYAMDNTRLNDYITEMVAVMKNIIPNHQISISLSTDVEVWIDKLRMEQVFSNLLGNAAKYSPEHTSISIDCRILEDQRVRIAVTDQGIGMSKEDMASVFNKFYRNKEVTTTHAGLGMGLYIASKIINDHDGKIWVESEEGVGSTFAFTLPYQGMVSLPLSTDL